MPALRVLLRFLLIVTFCLEGSLSVWAASSMAVDSAHQVTTAGVAGQQDAKAAIDKECEDEASTRGEGTAHEECDCAQGLGCACACVFPVVAITPAIPFAAQHQLVTVPAVPSRLPVVATATTPVFRPPIG